MLTSAAPNSASLFQFRSEPETTGDRQCEASRSVVDRKSISVAGEGSVMSIIGTRRAAARQAEGKARGEPVGNGGTAERLSIALCCGQRRCPRAGARFPPWCNGYRVYRTRYTLHVRRRSRLFRLCVCRRV